LGRQFIDMTRNMTMKLTTILALALLASAGCQSGPRPPNNTYGPPQIYFATEELRRDTQVDQPVVNRDENNLLRVTIPIRSAINYRLYVDYRVTWFDANGQPLNEHTGWLTKTLEPNVADHVTVTSTSPRAANFQVDFRYSH
jgi:uncharacterized protein YcfL